MAGREHPGRALGLRRLLGANRFTVNVFAAVHACGGMFARRLPLVKRSRSGWPAGAADILRHYVEHPGTADTLEGIAEWRLLEDLVHQRVMETDRALRWLIAKGYLEQITGTAATPNLYHLNPAKQHEAARLIARSRNHGSRRGRKRSR